MVIIKSKMICIVKIFVILIFLNTLTLCGSNDRDIDIDQKSDRPLIGKKIALADPFILLFNDLYYAYGTGANNGIKVMVSSDLKYWSKGKGKADEGLALHKNDVFGDKWFWAPEVYHVDGEFIMYFSSEEHTCAAISDSPLGPFVQTVKKPMIEREKSIDNTLFIDDDGKKYMFFDRFDGGLNICVAELNDDCMSIKGPVVSCIRVSQDWERVWPTVNEGCFVIKHNGTYYMTYSANSYESQSYGIGYAVATSPFGPWTKYPDNPILQKPGDLVGVGHSAMFYDKNGQLKIVFHAHHSKKSIHPREMYISDVTFIPVNGAPDRLVISDKYMTPLEVE